MLRRVATMEFAPRMMVFPGGGVDPRDADAGLPWAGPTPAEWAGAARRRRGDGPGLVAAAVREVFEECGVLLAGPTPDEVIADVSGEHWHEQRRRLLAPRGVAVRGAARARPAAALRPARLPRPLDHPRVRGAALRHPVLQRGRARRASAPTTTPPRPTSPTGSDRPTCCRPGGTARALMLPPDGRGRRGGRRGDVGGGVHRRAARRRAGAARARRHRQRPGDAGATCPAMSTS